MRKVGKTFHIKSGLWVECGIRYKKKHGQGAERVMTFLVFPTTARFRKFVLSYPVLLLHQKAGPGPVKGRCHNIIDMKTKSWAVWQHIRTHSGKQSMIVECSDLGDPLLQTTLRERRYLVIVTNSPAFISNRMETLSLIVSNWNLHLKSSSPFFVLRGMHNLKSLSNPEKVRKKASSLKFTCSPQKQV